MNNLPESLTIIFGCNGFLGKDLVGFFSNRGDKVIGIDRDKLSQSRYEFQYIAYETILTEKCFVKFFKKIPKSIKNMNFIFSHCFEEPKQKNYTKKNSDINDYRNKVFRSWVESNSKLYEVAIQNQISIVDDFLKNFKKHLLNDDIRKNIIFFGSAFEKKSFLIDLFFKNKKYIFKPPAYFISKKALLAYQSFLVDLFKNLNIRTNTISPGVIDRNQKNDLVDFIKSSTPIKKALISNDEIISLVSFLTDSKNNSCMNNQVLYADFAWADF